MLTGSYGSSGGSLEVYNPNGSLPGNNNIGLGNQAANGSYGSGTGNGGAGALQYGNQIQSMNQSQQDLNNSGGN
jgi:hypothetical protein